jgi:hypothetical protein
MFLSIHVVDLDPWTFPFIMFIYKSTSIPYPTQMQISSIELQMAPKSELQMAPKSE